MIFLLIERLISLPAVSLVIQRSEEYLEAYAAK